MADSFTQGLLNLELAANRLPMTM